MLKQVLNPDFTLKSSWNTSNTEKEKLCASTATALVGLRLSKSMPIFVLPPPPQLAFWLTATVSGPAGDSIPKTWNALSGYRGGYDLPALARAGFPAPRSIEIS